MAFLVTNLVQRMYRALGQVDPTTGLFTVTGGSATTFVNTAFGDLENPPEQDVFKGQLAIVVRDAAGAGASPEGKWGLVSAYADATYAGTIATVTDAIASGDTIMLAKQDKFPLQQILASINDALTDLGDVPTNADTSLTTAAGQTEYNIPVAVKRGLKEVWVKTNDDVNDGRWERVNDKRNELTGAGTASVLFIPQWLAGQTIKLIYDGPHAVISTYSDVINEYIHPKVITAAAIVKLLEWYNRRDENQEGDSYFLWLEGQYKDIHLPLALAEEPIQEEKKAPKFFSRGEQSIKYSRYGPQLAE